MTFWYTENGTTYTGYEALERTMRAIYRDFAEPISLKPIVELDMPHAMTTDPTPPMPDPAPAPATPTTAPPAPEPTTPERQAPAPPAPDVPDIEPSPRPRRVTAILATTTEGRRLRLEAALGDHADPCATCPPDRNTRLAELLIHVEPEGAAPGTTGRTLPVCGQCIADMLIAGLIAAQQATADLPGLPCDAQIAADRVCTRPEGHAGPCRA
jgi:hypothetical protein